MTKVRSVGIGAILISCAFLLAASAEAGARIEKEFELQPGGNFRLETDNGSVEVIGTSRSGARLIVTSRSDDIESYYDMDFQAAPDRVEVRVEKKASKKSWFGWRRGINLKFEIEVPHETELEIYTSGGSISVEAIERRTDLDTSGGSITASGIGGEIMADTSGGSIRIEDVEGDVNAETSGGSIDVASVHGEVQADTSGGSIRIHEVSGDIRADTSGGSIRIDQAGGHVRAETSGGGVQVAFSAGNARGGELSTSGGKVVVALDPTVDLDVDASASGGTLMIDVPLLVRGEVSRQAIRGTLGDGGAQLRLRASGGGIRIEPL
jgi:DUF4097 and DUF4098 domain-containing protein YvlB